MFFSSGVSQPMPGVPVFVPGHQGFAQHVQFAGQQMMESQGAPSHHGPQGSGGPQPGTVVGNGRGTDYKVIKELGAGCFGTVCKVQRQRDGKVLAMKFQELQSPQQRQEIQKEVDFLRKMRNPNIVSFFEDFSFQRYICIVMEFCDGGTLQKHVESRKQRGFSVLRIAGYVAQLADGLEFIHSKNVAHRDLKSENVMMTSTMQIKISDFGCGKTLPQGSNAVMTMTGGDMMIIPPEMAHRIQGVPAQGQVGPAYDMWGCGVILAEMVTLQLMRKDICKSKPLSLNKPAEDKILSDAKRNYGGKFYNLLSNLLQHNPDRRWSARQVRNEVKSFLKSEHKASDGQTLKKVAAQLGVPESQLAEAWTNFQTADTHGKGAITVGQLKALLTLLHIDVSSRALMERFDADKSGTMDFKEFATFWLQRNSSWMPTVVPGSTSGAEDAIMVQRVYGIPAGDFQKLKAAFQNYDTDRSGDVTAIGMWTVLQTAGVNMGSDFQSYLDRFASETPTHKNIGCMVHSTRVFFQTSLLGHPKSLAPSSICCTCRNTA